ncbi:hypothetical protein J6590_060306 [Homalodisca vitripennis]|nr:hypothetical protein J6590_060306 [Homalodisca vitripennis]
MLDEYEDRKSEWEQIARDRDRFRKRIAESEEVFKSTLKKPSATMEFILDFQGFKNIINDFVIKDLALISTNEQLYDDSSLMTKCSYNSRSRSSGDLEGQGQGYRRVLNEWFALAGVAAAEPTVTLAINVANKLHQNIYTDTQRLTYY